MAEDDKTSSMALQLADALDATGQHGRGENVRGALAAGEWDTAIYLGVSYAADGTGVPLPRGLARMILDEFTPPSDYIDSQIVKSCNIIIDAGTGTDGDDAS